jgi:hypothetical protein
LLHSKRVDAYTHFHRRIGLTRTATIRFQEAGGQDEEAARRIRRETFEDYVPVSLIGHADVLIVASSFMRTMDAYLFHGQPYQDDAWSALVQDWIRTVRACLIPDSTVGILDDRHFHAGDPKVASP